MATKGEACASGSLLGVQIAPVALTNIQSLVQLSIALNAAYFTFRSGNRPAYDDLASKLEEVESTISAHQLYDVEKINNDVLNVGDSVHSFEYWRDLFYSLIDFVMLYIGYGLALCGVLTLLVCSILPDFKIKYGWALLIAAILYSPVSLAILMEVVLGTMCFWQRRKVKQLNIDCQYAIAQVRQT